MFMLSLALCSLAVLHCYVHTTFKVFFFFEPAFWNQLCDDTDHLRIVLLCRFFPQASFERFYGGCYHASLSTVRIHQLLFTIIPDNKI